MGRSEFAEGDFGFSDTGPGDLPDALSWPQRQDDCALGRSPGKGLAMPWAVGRPGAFPYTCARRPSSRAAGPGTGAQHTGCSAAWLARLLWEQEAAGSNPAIPTRSEPYRSRLALAWELMWEPVVARSPHERHPPRAPGRRDLLRSPGRCGLL